MVAIEVGPVCVVVVSHYHNTVNDLLPAFTQYTLQQRFFSLNPHKMITQLCPPMPSIKSSHLSFPRSQLDTAPGRWFCKRMGIIPTPPLHPAVKEG